jgi:hypothetical protein
LAIILFFYCTFHKETLSFIILFPIFQKNQEYLFTQDSIDFPPSLFISFYENRPKTIQEKFIWTLHAAEDIFLQMSAYHLLVPAININFKLSSKNRSAPTIGVASHEKAFTLSHSNY